MSQSAAARLVGVPGDQTNMTSATEIELVRTPLEMLPQLTVFQSTQ